MNKKNLLLKFDELLELPAGTLDGRELLEDLGGWDSVTVLRFMAMADSDFGVRVSPQRIAESKTTNDLTELLSGSAVSGSR